MDQSKIPVRYARALFLLGKEKGIIDKLAADINLLSEFFINTPSVTFWLKNPVIKPEQKKSTLRKHFEGKVTETTIKFVSLVISKNREKYFPDIFRNFIRFYKADAGIRTFILTTAVKADAVIKQSVGLKFAKEQTTGHEIITKVKPSIIGGFMVQCDDLLYDASVATELNRMKKELTGQVIEEAIRKTGS